MTMVMLVNYIILCNIIYFIFRIIFSQPTLNRRRYDVVTTLERLIYLYILAEKNTGEYNAAKSKIRNSILLKFI
jgi:hypothetical protein